MLFDRRNDIEPDEFWKSRERDLNLPILGKVLGQVIREGGMRPIWGLFYTTSRALYFQTFQSDNWLMKLFSSGQQNRTRDEIIEIPIEKIELFRVRSRNGGLLKFLQKPPLIELSWQDATGELRKMNFETNGDAEAFVRTLPR